MFSEVTERYKVRPGVAPRQSDVRLLASMVPFLLPRKPVLHLHQPPDIHPDIVGGVAAQISVIPRFLRTAYQLLLYAVDDWVNNRSLFLISCFLIIFTEGRCVGGSTEINSACWHRTPDAIARSSYNWFTWNDDRLLAEKSRSAHRRSVEEQIL